MALAEPRPTLATLAPDLYKCPSVTRNPIQHLDEDRYSLHKLERCSSWTRKFEVLVSAIKVSLNFFFSSKLRWRRMFWWWPRPLSLSRPGSPSDICQVQLCRDTVENLGSRVTHYHDWSHIVPHKITAQPPLVQLLRDYIIQSNYIGK